MGPGLWSRTAHRYQPGRALVKAIERRSRPPTLWCAGLAAFVAAGRDPRIGAANAAALGGERDLRAAVGLTEVAAVFEQSALLPTEEAHRELGHRRVGNALETGAQPGEIGAFDRDRIDEADQGHVDRPVQVGDDVREFPIAAV